MMSSMCLRVVYHIACDIITGCYGTMLIPQLVGKWFLEFVGCRSVKLIAKKVLHQKNLSIFVFKYSLTTSQMRNREGLASE